MYNLDNICSTLITLARLAQLVEHQTFNLRAKGSSPLSGELLFFFSTTNSDYVGYC